MNPNLLTKLKSVPAHTLLGITIQNAIETNNLDELEKALRDYYEDNQMGLTFLLGFDLLSTDK